MDPLSYFLAFSRMAPLQVATWGHPVTSGLPTNHIRGRLSYAFYRTMDVLDCVARSPEEYIEIAVRLGTDPALRARTRQRIAAHADTLYDDSTVASELGQAMLRMARELEEQ
jgi:predicted O-linked N-acetylglucosamine transferase (SPINDLY family)